MVEFDGVLSMTDEYINPGDTVLGIYKDKKYPNIMSWPAWAREDLLASWEDENTGRNRDEIQAKETLAFPSSNFPRQFGFRGNIGDDKALNLKQYMQIMKINSGSRLSGENAVNSLRNVMGMSANFSLPKSAVSATYLKHVMGLQDDEIVSKIIHMANNADLESMDDYDRWYNQWGFDRKYYKEASEVFEKYIKGREAEIESGRKATKFKAWEEGQKNPSYINITKQQILNQLKLGQIPYDQAPEQLRQALGLGGIDQAATEAALTSFLKEIEEFKPYNPDAAKKMERWVSLARISEKEQSTRVTDLLKLNGEVRDSINTWFMKGMSGRTDEQSRESVVGGELWNIVNQLPHDQQALVWEFLKSQSPFPDKFESGAFGGTKMYDDRLNRLERGTISVVVKDSKGIAKTIEVPNFPRDVTGTLVVDGVEQDMAYDILSDDGKRARMRQLEGLLYPRYIVDQIIDFEVEQASQ